MLTQLALFAVALFSLSSFCAEPEIVWIKMEVDRTYQDADANCFGASAIGQVLLSAEVVDGKASKVVLHNYMKVWPYTSIYRAVALTEPEKNSIKFYQDKRSVWWLSEIGLSEATLRWVIYESGRRHSFCPAPQPVKTVDPKGQRFKFETDGLDEGIWISRSNKVQVSGNRDDGKPYKGSIRLVQKESGDEW